MSLPSELLPVGLLGTGATGGYEIERSLRFNSADSAYLSRTPASAGNRKTWTWAGWVKKVNNTTSRQFIFNADVTSNNSTIEFKDNAISVFDYYGGYQWQVVTNALFRDNSAWMHVVVAVDTTQGTAANRVKVYVNGTQQTFSTANYPTQEYQSKINATVDHRIGSLSGNASFDLDAYLSDIHFIDGQALDPTSFGEFDENGIWQPKRYSGTYGTNGFHLDFSDNSAATATTLGADSSGNGNNWAPNNFSVTAGGPTSVAAASGALPIYNTTDTYGTTKGVGTRTDSNSSSIVLAIPMDGANNGTTFTDESATIKGSGSAKSITRNGDTKTVTAQSKFYGSSGFFDGSGDSLSIANSSDFTVNTYYTLEAWIYPTSHGSERTVFFRLQLGGSYPGYILRLDNGYPLLGSSSNDLTSSIICPLNTWSHVAWVFNNSGNQRIYVNGILGASRTNGPTTMDYSDNLYIGAASDSSRTFYGYIQDARVYRVEKYTSNFNPPSSTANPTIAAGNDSLIDVPQNGTQTDTGLGGEVRGNYATWNPLDNPVNATTFADGNLQATATGANNSLIRSTIAMPLGKWYMELTCSALGGNYPHVGILRATQAITGSNPYLGFWPGGYAMRSDGSKENSAGTSSYGSSFTVGDVIGIAFDNTAGTLTYYKNGVSQGTAFSSIPAGNYYYAWSGYSNASFIANFGQRPFAYQAPSGFKALNTANLPTPTILDGSDYMDVVTYTGNGSTQTISGLEFSPDLVWLKARSSGGSSFTNHVLVDSVRGAGSFGYKNLYSNLTDSEFDPTSTATASVTVLNSDGFALGGNANTNTNTMSVVAWTWDAGSTTVTNTDGSITSSVRANPSAGFSIVTWNGNGSANQSIGHGLGVTPSLIITKNRDNGTGYNWNTWFTGFTANEYLNLNTTDGKSSYSSLWYQTPNSSVFYVGSTGTAVNNSTNRMVAYCFAPVEGYSAFGSYTGNGSTDGVFVYTGHRPRWLLIKSTNNTYNWQIFDTSRDSYNVAARTLYPNLSNAEDDYTSLTPVDILSNGFKLRTTSIWNTSSTNYIYASFAENPFSVARAR